MMLYFHVFYIKLAFDHFFASRYHLEVNYNFAVKTLPLVP